MNEISQLISSVGFPIACCIFLFWNQSRTEDRHKEEVEKLRASLDNNTRVMTRICDRLNIDPDEKGE